MNIAAPPSVAGQVSDDKGAAPPADGRGADLKDLKAAAPAQPDSAETGLLLQLALHEENTLNNRVNIFLVVESLLLVLYAEVVTTNASLALPLAAFGVVITMIWLLTSMRQGADLKSSVLALRSGWRSFEKIYAKVPPALKAVSLFLLVWGLPVLFVVLWIVVAGDNAGLIDLPSLTASGSTEKD